MFASTLSWLPILLPLVNAPAQSSPADAIQAVLTNDACVVTISPESLRTSARLANGVSTLLSAGQDGLGPVESFHGSSAKATWELPRRAVSISASLAGRDLTVEIRSAKPGSFTWPLLHLSEPVQALIWPSWEGRYVPLDHPEWQGFLAGQEWDTVEGLCMPFWGVGSRDFSVTYVAVNRYNNNVTFDFKADPAMLRFRHDFPASEKEWVYGFVIHLSENTSPVEPARVFRNWLTRQGAFVPMRDKLKTVPRAERLLGAPHVYLWGDSFLTRHDILPTKWRTFCERLVAQARADEPSPANRLHALMSPAGWKQVEEITRLEWPDSYVKSEVASELSRLLERPDFYDKTAWREVAVPPDAERLLALPREKLSTADLCRMNGLLLRAAFPDVLLPVEEWGDGVSGKMLRALKEGGLDRARLCLSGWEGIEKRPEVAKVADEMGYLFGTYDSFHSIHDPSLAGTDASWPTAQFDRDLYENGAIVREDGTKRTGFRKQGYLLSPRAARSHVERRVMRNMANVPYSYYFVDCDAYGQVYDDYSALHPSTQVQDAAARVDRLSWIASTFKVVVGSEGGSSYAAPAVHVVEGMLTPGIGWGDADMKDKQSRYYLGAYYPSDGPRVFLQSVSLKERYVRLYHDPQFRLPLYEIVFHDSVVSTHHWGNGSLKFSNVRETVALTEMLYQCPPLYHLNLDEWKKQREGILKHQNFFAPIHREVGFSPMTDFVWLTPDRLVQKTAFGDRMEIIVNFGTTPFENDQGRVAPGSVTARWLATGKRADFTPNPEGNPGAE